MPKPSGGRPRTCLLEVTTGREDERERREIRRAVHEKRRDARKAKQRAAEGRSHEPCRVRSRIVRSDGVRKLLRWDDASECARFGYLEEDAAGAVSEGNEHDLCER